MICTILIRRPDLYYDENKYVLYNEITTIINKENDSSKMNKIIFILYIKKRV